MIAVCLGCSLGLVIGLGSPSSSDRDVEVIHSANLADTSFFEQAPSDQVDSFRGLSTDEQFYVYTQGLRREPPTLYLAHPFGEEGGRVVGLLQKNISSAEDDITVWGLLLVFEQMHRLKTYDTADARDLMHSLEFRVKSMHEGPLKRDA